MRCIKHFTLRVNLQGVSTDGHLHPELLQSIGTDALYIIKLAVGFKVTSSIMEGESTTDALLNKAKTIH